MENNDKFVKYIAIIALLFAVVGISVGFAAYTNTVNIKATAVVGSNPVIPVAALSTDPSQQDPGNVVPTTTGGATGDTGVLGNDTIQNMKAHFTTPGQTVTYSFYGYNGSTFLSYLNSVVFGSKSCNTTGLSNPATNGVSAACDDIIMTITVGTGASQATFTTDNTNVSGHSLAAGASEPIVVTISYLDGTGHGHVADGEFNVDFGTTVLTYSTVD